MPHRNVKSRCPKTGLAIYHRKGPMETVIRSDAAPVKSPMLRQIDLSSFLHTQKYAFVLHVSRALPAELFTEPK